MGDFSGWLEKKNAIGMWGRKFITLRGLTIGIADTEGAAPAQSLDLQGITRGGEVGDPQVLVFLSPAGDVPLRGSTQPEADKWYDMTHGALVAAGKAKSKTFGLPAIDPRNNLKFVEIPPEFAARFVNLERAVLYWFSSVKKYGTPSRITGKCSTEDRVGFIGDKAFYVTKPNSEVTRCLKINAIKEIFTNVGVRTEKEEPFIVFKMPSPDFDLYIGHPNIESLVTCLQSLYSYLNRGQELKVTKVKQAQDPSVQLQLARPSGFEMFMVVPTTKEQLKKALDKFAAKHGITFAAAETPAGSPGGSIAPAASAQSPSAGGGTNAAAASSPAKDPNAVPRTDPLGCFLLKLNLEKYYMLLYKNSVDFDVLEVMDDTDLKNFGVEDDAAISTIRAKLSDADFMDAVKSEVEAARKGWVKPEANPAPASVQSTPAPAKATPIILDDSDDDLLAPAPTQSGTFAICLDSDDDLDLPPPKPKPAAAPISLSDDDDI